MKNKTLHIVLALTALLAMACSDIDWSLTPEQESLLGKAVNFNASMAEEFAESRTSYEHNGKFNEGDLMQIYRQYWDSNNKNWEDLQAYRTYSFDVTYATGTTINLGEDWKVAVGRMKCDDWNSETKSGTMVEQKMSDSLTWENGATVRFRAWSRSNVAGCIGSGSAGAYYPDFCIADWVTVSGPTTGIPLVLRHVGSRIGFRYYGGNQLAGVEICTQKEDYMWQDNSDSHTNDEADMMNEAEAEAAAADVKAVVNRMCLPAGVDIESGTLRSMTTSLYGRMTDKSDPLYNTFNKIEQRTVADGLVEFGTLTPSAIANEVAHPRFSNVDGRCYMITIPYDMSNDPNTRGEILTLPAKTRFKIKIRDVNNGDAANTPGYEAKEHIFSLTDIKNSDGTPKYPNGLEMLPGKSYLFTVGYLYDRLTVSIIEEGISWNTADSEDGQAADQSVADDNTSPYQWWKDAINQAITETKGSEDYNPIFRISTATEFKEFIALVNGTAARKTSGLERASRSQENPEADEDLDNRETRHYWWYDVEATKASLASEFGDTIWVTRAEAEAQGYVFYRHYYPQVSDKAAYSVEDYVRGPISFYDEQVNLHLVVQLTQDIDLHDWQMESVGNSEDNPFMGFFDGGTHTLSNVNMRQEYLFGYVTDGEIRDLRLTSTHRLALLKYGNTSATTRNLRIVGISLQADCSASPIQSLLGTAYVVGCIHEGDAGGALVGTANNLTMYGCMHASSNITGAALLGSYAAGSQSRFFDPQNAATVVKWGQFMCNYYQKSPDQATRAVATTADNYRAQEYIRGARQHILRAKNDNLVDDDVPYEKLSDNQKAEFYGLAPWKAMNYAIYQYNQTSVAKGSEYSSKPESHLCHMIYKVDDVGYAHRYPVLAEGTPTNEGVKNITTLNN